MLNFSLAHFPILCFRCRYNIYIHTYKWKGRVLPLYSYPNSVPQLRLHIEIPCILEVSSSFALLGTNEAFNYVYRVVSITGPVDPWTPGDIT